MLMPSVQRPAHLLSKAALLSRTQWVGKTNLHAGSNKIREVKMGITLNEHICMTHNMKINL